MLSAIRSPLVIALAVSLSACGGSDTPEQAPKPAAVEKPSPTIAPESAPVETASAETQPEATATSEGSPEFAGLPEPYASADYARGKRVFRTCSACHLLDAGAGNLVGPNLHGMFDRGIGELEGFGYSKALQEADFQWSAEKLDEWLANPRSFLPRNNMSFTGVRRENDRDAVIAYLLIETAK